MTVILVNDCPKKWPRGYLKSYGSAPPRRSRRAELRSQTVLLKQLAALDEQAFCLSMDTADPVADVFDLVRRLSENYSYRTFLLDEVHYHPGIDGVRSTCGPQYGSTTTCARN